MQEFKEFLTIISWPHIALIFGIIFLFLFYPQIAGFISRVRSVGKGGVTTHSDITPQIQDDNKTDLLQHIEIDKTALLIEVEEGISEDLKARKLESNSDALKVLVRNLAVTKINLEHEQTYNTIFGTQIHLLKKLNETPGTGRPIEYVENFYKVVQQNNEKVFDKWSLDDYLEYLKSRSLITFKSNNWHISVKGQDFVIWLAKNGRNEMRAY